MNKLVVHKEVLSKHHNREDSGERNNVLSAVDRVYETFNSNKASSRIIGKRTPVFIEKKGRE